MLTGTHHENILVLQAIDLVVEQKIVGQVYWSDRAALDIVNIIIEPRSRDRHRAVGGRAAGDVFGASAQDILAVAGDGICAFRDAQRRQVRLRQGVEGI